MFCTREGELEIGLINTRYAFLPFTEHGSWIDPLKHVRTRYSSPSPRSSARGLRRIMIRLRRSGWDFTRKIRANRALLGRKLLTKHSASAGSIVFDEAQITLVMRIGSPDEKPAVLGAR